MYKGVEDMNALFQSILERQPTRVQPDATATASATSTQQASSVSRPPSPPTHHAQQSTQTHNTPLGTTAAHSTQHTHSEPLPHQPAISLNTTNNKKLEDLD
jgi:hypothetical protein